MAPQRVTFTKGQLKEMVRLYTKQGWTLVDLELHFGLNAKSIRRYLIELGVTLRPPGRRKKKKTYVIHRPSPDLLSTVGLTSHCESLVGGESE